MAPMNTRRNWGEGEIESGASYNAAPVGGRCYEIPNVQDVRSKLDEIFKNIRCTKSPLLSTPPTPDPHPHPLGRVTMDPGMGLSSGSVRKMEDSDGGDSKRDIKPVKTLNRVPRACNACRKQKMRCEGADNPPCKRCRNAGLECLFEKPSREATLTGEAGLERIRSLESHVSDIRVTQGSIQNALSEILGHIRGGNSLNRSAVTQFSQTNYNRSPSLQSMGSPPMAQTPTGRPALPPVVIAHQQRSGGQQHPMSPPVQGPQNANAGQYHHPHVSPPYNANVPPSYNANQHAPVLPPFSSLPSGATQEGAHHQSHRDTNSGSKRTAPSSSNPSNVTSEHSDFDDDHEGELPAHGLVAPWEVLRNLANVAIQREQRENGDSSEPHSRARTPSPDRQTRPTKRRKVRHKVRGGVYQDVVTKEIISEKEARELFRIFFHGCSTFLPVFDANQDTYDTLHDRSPFAVNCICMVAARVRDGGGKASETYKKVLEEVHEISRASLFTPVTRHEAVQAMILVAGWSDNGWLSGGHAVRMAMEISLHRAWPTLLNRMKRNNISVTEDKDLVIQTRIWFSLYLFEHQLSYGTGRPAILKDDETIWECRHLLQHPLAIEDDMRLVSTVELMAIRERVQNSIANEGPVDHSTFEALRQADGEFRNWYTTWDTAFSQKYEDAAFYRQSLQIQHLHAELFHNASALRDINGPSDVQRMPQAQRDLALRSITIAQQGLDITVSSPAYREGMKYAVHYTHATATFAATFLLRLARLFPNECNMQDITSHVERLAALMNEIPGKRYALTLQLMLKRAKKRKSGSSSRSPRMPREPYPPHHRSLSMVADTSNNGMATMNQQPMNPEQFSPTYDPSFSSPDMHGHPHQQVGAHMQHPGVNDAPNADNIWRGFEMTSNEQLPVWLSDQTLGGNSFSQNGMDAFLLPNDYLPPAPQIW